MYVLCISSFLFARRVRCITKGLPDRARRARRPRKDLPRAPVPPLRLPPPRTDASSKASLENSREPGLESPETKPARPEEQPQALARRTAAAARAADATWCQELATGRGLKRALPIYRSLALRTASLRTKILDFRGFDSSITLILRRGILRSIGNFPETLTQQILVGRFLIGRLGLVPCSKLLQALQMSCKRAPSGGGHRRRPSPRPSLWSVGSRLLFYFSLLLVLTLLLSLLLLSLLLLI